jgi:hypothetical protein
MVKKHNFGEKMKKKFKKFDSTNLLRWLQQKRLKRVVYTCDLVVRFYNAFLLVQGPML